MCFIHVYLFQKRFGFHEGTRSRTRRCSGAGTAQQFGEMANFVNLVYP